MATITPEDILAAAQRAGWSMTPARVREIADAAGPVLEAFETVRSRLTFDDETAGFIAALVATKNGSFENKK